MAEKQVYYKPDRPSGWWGLKAEQERSLRSEAERKSARESAVLGGRLSAKDLRTRSYTAKTGRLEATSGAVRAGMGLFTFLKPVIVFMLIVVLVLGLGWRALETILVSVGWWWIAIIVLIILFYKYR